MQEPSRSDRKPRAPRSTRNRTRRAKPTPPAPLPEGKGEKNHLSPFASGEPQEASSAVPPLPSGWGAGGVGFSLHAPVPHLVTRQKVDVDKVARARELRREMTLAEQLLWEQVRASKLCGLHFRRQQLVHGFIADFYCHAAGVVVEVDGGIHDEQPGYDDARDLAFATLGLLVLRFRNEEVAARMPDVLERIAAACAERISENLS
ncbi:MAG: DUF559 domain-containing protein [Planctomycetes bacterium]|nr:DUF559 domain-containing protein [Planctomycetota bacterium]